MTTPLKIGSLKQLTESAWDIVGWTGTVIFLASFFIKDRALLHLLGLVGCIIKLAYTYHFRLWPLVVNWLLLIVIELVQYFRYRNNHEKPKIDEIIKTNL